MAPMVTMEEPTDADVRRLALSVDVQRRDNLRLEQLLSELDWLRQHPPFPGSSPNAKERFPRSHLRMEPTVNVSRHPIQHTRLKAPGRAIAGEPRYAHGAYSYSLDSTFHRWRRRLVRQGVMASLAGWRSYWAQWDIHTLGRAFCGLRGQCQLRALGRDARCFRMLRLWERYIVMCRVWRAWRVVRDIAHHRRTSLSTRTFQCWCTTCKKRKRIRELGLRVCRRWRQRTVLAVLLSWRSFIGTVKERRAHVEQIALSAVIRAQSLLSARSVDSWIEWVLTQRAVRHQQRIGWRSWQRQRRMATVRHMLQELISRVRRRSVYSVLYHWREQVHKNIAARRMQAILRAFVARQAMARTRTAAIRLQRHWRTWLLRRQTRLLASAVARLRLREISSAWHGWRHAVRTVQQLRNALVKALADWQRITLVRALNQWMAHKRVASLQDKERQLTDVLRSLRLRQVLLQWRVAVYRNNSLRTAWRQWRQMCQLARLSRSQLETAAALQIQTFVRRSTQSRNAARERTAATVLQSLIRALLEQQSMRSTLQAKLDGGNGSNRSDDGCPTTAQDDDDQSDASATNQHSQLRDDARVLEAQSRAARAVSHPQENHNPSSPGLANTSAQLSDAGADADALVSLKRKYTELRRILNKMEVGTQLHMHTPKGRTHATVWVELDLQQLRWECRGQQTYQQSRTHAEHSQNFDHIIRVCWGAGMPPLESLRVHNPEMSFSCECDDGSWLHFEASDATQLRDWVLGLQALVSKPGVPLVDASRLEWLLQQTRAAPPRGDEHRNALLAPPALGSENIPNFHFDINQYLSECFDSVLDRNGNGCASVPALVDEIVVMLNTPDTARQGVGKEDLRALERIRNALLHEFLAQGRIWISFTQLVQTLTSESDVDWARLYSNPHATVVTTTHRNGACDDFDAAVLAGVGLRMGSTIEIKMPVFERKAVTESKWMWRRCSIVRKAAGRYYDIEDEKLRVLMAKMAKGGSLSAQQGYLDGYLDKYRPQPGWRAMPPSTNSVAGAGQPVFELYFEGRQPSRFEGFVRYGGLPDKQEFSAVYREGAFIPQNTRAGKAGGRLWLRATPRHQWLDPVEVMARLDGRIGKPLSWMEKPCWVSVEGHMLFLRQAPGVDDALALDLDRCTLAEAANGALAVLGPSLQRKFPVTDNHAVLVLTPHGSALQSDTNQPREPAQVSVELKDVICARQRAIFEWRPVADASSVPTAFHQ